MLIRRCVAYFIDVLLITFLVSLISSISFINPNYEKYENANNKILEMTTEYIQNPNEDIINSDEYQDLVYETEVNGVVISIIELVVYIAYFVFFQVWNKGQTVGKRILNIKLVTNKDKNPWLMVSLRYIFLFSLYIELINVILVNVLSKSSYLQISSALGTVATIILYVCAFSICFSKDGIGLHDIVGKTKVISTKEKI